MNCHDACTELGALLPREPYPEPLRAHLAKCAACRARAERLAAVDAALAARFRRLEPRPEFDTRLRAAIARAESERDASARERIEPPDLEPVRRLLRAGSILDGIAAVGVGATVLGLVVQMHGTLERWLDLGTSGQVSVLGTSGTAVIGTVTAAGVAAIVAAAAGWAASRRT